MPLAPEHIHIELACGRRPDGSWHGTYTIRLRAADLRQLGLHPDQPTSRIVGPVQPGWWRAEAMRRFGCYRW